MDSIKTIAIGITAAAVFTTAMVLDGWSTVGTGKRGLKVKFGEIVSEAPLTEGFYFKLPFVESIKEVNVRTQTITGKMETYTKDVQTASFDYTVYFNLDPAYVKEMYREFGANWEESFVPQAVFTQVKDVVGKWDAVTLVNKQEEARLQMFENLKVELAKRNIIVTNLATTNFDYSDTFEAAIEAKVVAIQRASEAENKTKQIEEEAKQKVIAAKAEAESMKIRSEALSQNQNLVSYEAVQKWDGKMPQYMLGNGTMPFINIDKK